MHEQNNAPALVGERLRDRGYELHEHVVTPDSDQPNVASPFPPLDGFDVLVLMGSLRSLTRKHEIASWIHQELDIIRTAHDAAMPILGICFGGQLIAEALGGTVEEAPVTEIGWYEIEGPDNPVGPGPWQEWHHDRFIPPACAAVLATNENAVQLFTIGRSLGTQFHPEVTPPHVKAWAEACDDAYLEEWGTDRYRIEADATVHEVNNREQCARLVDFFLDHVSQA